MPSNTDKSHGDALTSATYEKRDASVRPVITFLISLAVILVVVVLLCWGLFRYFSAELVDRTPASPFVETRQLPPGPQLQVHPHQDFESFRTEQEQSLESYAWENRAAGTVRIPIERAMELLLQKGLPVEGPTSTTMAGKPAPKGGTEQ